MLVAFVGVLLDQPSDGMGVLIYVSDAVSVHLHTIGEAAEQFPDGLLAELAVDVPQGDIEGADGWHGSAVGAPEAPGVVVHLLPEHGGTGRILSD